MFCLGIPGSFLPQQSPIQGKYFSPRTHTADNNNIKDKLSFLWLQCITSRSALTNIHLWESFLHAESFITESSQIIHEVFKESVFLPTLQVETCFFLICSCPVKSKFLNISVLKVANCVTQNTSFSNKFKATNIPSDGKKKKMALHFILGLFSWPVSLLAGAYDSTAKNSPPEPGDTQTLLFSANQPGGAEGDCPQSEVTPCIPSNLGPELTDLLLVEVQVTNAG